MSIRDDFFAAKAKGSLWDVAVSIKRGNPLPLDADSIFESYAALEAYAADVLAYPGQVVAVVNADSTGIYYLDQDLAIQPVGVVPAGDGLSVVMDDNDVISLHNYGKVFYKYVAEEGEVAAHYEKVNVGDPVEEGSDEVYTWKAGLEPKVVTENGKLVIGWYEPNPTTIEGVNDQVTAVQGTVADLEESVGAPSSEGSPATGLYKEVEDVQADVEELVDIVGTSDDQLGDTVNTLWAHVNDHDSRLDVIEADYLKTSDKEELQDAIDAIEIPVVGVTADDKVLALSADKLISATVAMSYDETGKKIILSGKDGVELGSVDATPFIKDGMLEDVSYDADSNTLTFKWNTAAGITEDTVVLSDIIEPYTAGNGLVLSGNEFAIKLADGSESFLSLSADGLKLSGIADAIAAAKSEAIADAASAAAGIYATQTALGELESALDGRLDVLEAIDHTLYATNEALGNLENTLDGRLDVLEAYDHATYATKEELKTTDDKAVSNANSITNLTSRLDGIVAQGGEPNTINTIKVNGVAQAIDSEKAVDIAVPTAMSQLSDWATVDARITAAQTQANKGVDDAAAAKAVADANAETLANHAPRIEALETAKGNHETRIIALENADSQHASEYTALKGIVDGHTTSLAGKADQTALDAVSAKASANESAIKTINETTIPGINAEIANKANSADVYTKSEVGAIEEGKTLVEMIAAAAEGAEYDDAELRGLIANNTQAVLDEKARAEAAEKANADEIARVNGVLVNALENDAEGLDSIKELAAWINSHGTEAADMAAAIEANTDAIAAINDADTGILALANKYADDAIAAIPVATAEVYGLVKYDDKTIKMNASNQLYTAEVSTDILVQGTNELILNGGSAV